MKKTFAFLVVCFLVLSALVSCGGGEQAVKADLNNTFTGKYFTIDCTYDFSAKETEYGAVLTDSKSGLEVEVAGIPFVDAKKGDISSLDMFIEGIEEEVENLSKKTVTIDGHKALWIEGDNKGLHGVMVLIPMEKWIIIDSVRKPVDDANIVEMSRQIVRSFKITDSDFFSEMTNSDKDISDKPIEKEVDYSNKDEAEHPVEDEDINKSNAADEKDVDNKPSSSSDGRKLDELYTGNYFTVKHPSSAEVMDFSYGDDDMVMFTIDKLNVTIMASKENESVSAEEELGVEKIKVSGRDANLFEMSMGEALVSNCIIEMDGWWILIMGTSEGSEIGGDKETFRSMLDSFSITKPDYLK